MWNRSAGAVPQSPCHLAADSSGRWIETRPVRLWKWTFSYWSSRLSRAPSPFSVQWWRILFVIYSTFTKIIILSCSTVFVFPPLHYDSSVSLAFRFGGAWAGWLFFYLPGEEAMWERRRGGGCCRKNMPNKCQFLSLFYCYSFSFRETSSRRRLRLIHYGFYVSQPSSPSNIIILLILLCTAGNLLRRVRHEMGKKNGIFFIPSRIIVNAFIFPSGGGRFLWAGWKRNWKLFASLYARFSVLGICSREMCKSFKSFFLEEAQERRKIYSNDITLCKNESYVGLIVWTMRLERKDGRRPEEDALEASVSLGFIAAACAKLKLFFRFAFGINNSTFLFLLLGTSRTP